MKYFIPILLFLSLPSEAIKVAVTEAPPSVLYENGEITGLEIDLLKGISDIYKIELEYIKCASHAQVLEMVKEGTCTIGAAGISITSEREEYLNFSRPTLQDGIGIMVLGREKTVLEKWGSIFLKLRGLFLLILSCTILLFVFELAKGGDGIRNSWAGLFDSFWCLWAVATTIGFGDITPKTWQGKVLVVCLSVVFIGIVFPTVVAEFTNSGDTILCDIHDLEDLKGKEIATKRKSTSVLFSLKYTNKENLTQTYDVGSALTFLEEGLVDAVVFDQSGLKYHAKRMNPKKFVLLPKTFKKEDHGFIFHQKDFVVREAVDKGLHRLIEEGVYDRVISKWLGEN